MTEQIKATSNAIEVNYSGIFFAQTQHSRYKAYIIQLISHHCSKTNKENTAEKNSKRNRQRNTLRADDVAPVLCQIYEIDFCWKCKKMNNCKSVTLAFGDQKITCIIIWFFLYLQFLKKLLNICKQPKMSKMSTLK